MNFGFLKNHDYSKIKTTQLLPFENHKFLFKKFIKKSKSNRQPLKVAKSLHSNLNFQLSRDTQQKKNVSQVVTILKEFLFRLTGKCVKFLMRFVLLLDFVHEYFN